VYSGKGGLILTVVNKGPLSREDRPHAHVTVIDVPAFLGGIGRAGGGASSGMTY
jgi:hypothetical protein